MLLWRKGGQEQTGEIDVKRPYVAAVVVAAGTSSRMQGLDKQLEEVGGIPVIVRTLLALSDSDWIDEIVLVTRRGTIPDMLALARAWGVPKIRSVIAGGQTRQQSVQLGVEAVGPQVRYVAVHDGARPFVCGQVIADAVFDAIRYGAAAPAVPVSDTIKVADANGMMNRPRIAAVFSRFKRLRYSNWNVTARRRRPHCKADTIIQTIARCLKRPDFQYTCHVGTAITLKSRRRWIFWLRRRLQSCGRRWRHEAAHWTWL